MIIVNNGECEVHTDLRKALERGESALAQAGIEDAQGEAIRLFCFAAGISRSELFLRQSKALSLRQDKPELSYDTHKKYEEESTGYETCEKIFSYDTYKKYEALLAKRLKRIPLQHILGTVNFFGFDFKVDDRALIPRFETELLVEKVIEKIKVLQNINREEPIKVLDLCTGTGVIGITVKRTMPNIKCTLSDISSDALTLAAENAKLLGTDVRIVQSDILKEFSKEKFDIIVSNPPYIRSAEIDKLQVEVREFDPKLALDGGADGLEFYRIIAKEVHSCLKYSGYLFCEIGADQGDDITKIFEKEGAVKVHIAKDFAGKDRTAEIRFNS